MSQENPTSVFVVMSNDFPHSVWADEEEAKAFCDRNNCGQVQQRIYWKVYPFQLVGKRDTPPPSEATTSCLF